MVHSKANEAHSSAIRGYGGHLHTLLLHFFLTCLSSYVSEVRSYHAKANSMYMATLSLRSESLCPCCRDGHQLLTCPAHVKLRMLTLYDEHANSQGHPQTQRQTTLY